MRYPGVAIFLVLEHRKTSKRVIATTTHIVFDMFRGGSKLGMLVMILKTLQNLVIDYSA